MHIYYILLCIASPGTSDPAPAPPSAPVAVEPQRRAQRYAPSAGQARALLTHSTERATRPLPDDNDAYALDPAGQFSPSRVVGLSAPSRRFGHAFPPPPPPPTSPVVSPSDSPVASPRLFPSVGYQHLSKLLSYLSSCQFSQQSARLSPAQRAPLPPALQPSKAVSTRNPVSATPPSSPLPSPLL